MMLRDTVSMFLVMACCSMVFAAPSLGAPLPAYPSQDPSMVAPPPRLATPRDSSPLPMLHLQKRSGQGGNIRNPRSDARQAHNKALREEPIPDLPAWTDKTMGKRVTKKIADHRKGISLSTSGRAFHEAKLTKWEDHDAALAENDQAKFKVYWQHHWDVESDPSRIAKKRGKARQARIYYEKKLKDLSEAGEGSGKEQVPDTETQ